MGAQSMMGATILVTTGQAMEWVPQMWGILIGLAVVKTQALGIVHTGQEVAAKTTWLELAGTATSIALR